VCVCVCVYGGIQAEGVGLTQKCLSGGEGGLQQVCLSPRGGGEAEMLVPPVGAGLLVTSCQLSFNTARATLVGAT
jgi:hypothetical protein